VVFNATFNNISVISWRAVLSVDETGCKSEFTPPGYTVIARRDRQDGYGGVFILVKSNTPCDELYSSKQSELVAISVGRSNNQPLIIAGLYRPPSGTQDQAEQICTEVQELVRNHANASFWLTGDFNLPDISWKHNISGNQNALGVNDAFLTLVEDIGLQQMIDFPTRNNATLDLFLTSRPSFINHLKPIPGISDHEALFIDSDVQAKLRRPTSRIIFLWKKADLEKLQNDMQAFCQSFISKFSTSHPVDSLWTAFKNGCLNVVGSNVPSKMTTERYIIR
jgi:hypothetical protein